MLPPEPGPPLLEIEVPERMVDPGRLPIEDAGELVVDHEELVLVDVAMDEDVSMPSSGFEQLGPLSELPTAAEAFRGLGGRIVCGLGVERAA